jgi:hypothetical protein
MIIELGDIHVNQALLTWTTCMLQANGKVAMWVGYYSVCSQVTNKGEIHYIEGASVVKLK